MIRWKLAPVLEKRGWTAYRLAREVGLTQPVAYRITRPGASVTRIDAATLDALCRAFDVQPGALLEFVPGRARPVPKSSPKVMKRASRSKSSGTRRKTRGRSR